MLHSTSELRLEHDDIQVRKGLAIINFVFRHFDNELHGASLRQHLYLSQEACAARVCVNPTLQEISVVVPESDHAL